MTTGRESKTRFLLYGAYGYTGRLAAELAASRKLDVVLAGRNADPLAELGGRLGLPTRVVGLNHPDQLIEALKDIACVVHMAGPFAATFAPMLSACLATRTNYVDITGGGAPARGAQRVRGIPRHRHGQSDRGLD
jgi:saccharopine dehydrogenase (NAD+, L-lysine-forming)